MSKRERHAREALAPTNSLLLEGNSRHEELLHVAEVKPLPIFRMMVTLRLVVRGSGREPQPQSPSSRLAVLHSRPAPNPLGRHLFTPGARAASQASAEAQPGPRLAGVGHLNLSLQTLRLRSSVAKHLLGRVPASRMSAVCGQACHQAPTAAAAEATRATDASR